MTALELVHVVYPSHRHPAAIARDRDRRLLQLTFGWRVCPVRSLIGMASLVRVAGSAELESVSVPTRTREVAPFPADPPWGIRRDEVTGCALRRGRSQVGWAGGARRQTSMRSMMGELISHTCWMRDIPDEAPVTMLSIPGTHNSCSVYGPLGFAKTQDLDLSDQLNAGIRFLDIRLAHYQNNVFVHHDVVHMGKNYADVLAICSNFLKKYPSEAILMSVKNEGRFDSILGRFAPSAGLGKFRGDPANWVIRSSSFEDAFAARTWQHIENSSLLYNFAPPLPGSGSVGTNLALTSETTLGEVRGKIVLLRRFECNQDGVGLDLTYWPENQCFRSATTPIYNVEDRYQDPGEDNKYNFVIAHIEQARRGDPRDLYITFSSAVNLRARGYSKRINPRINDYLAGFLKGRVGIIVMDYFEEPRELVSNVIKMNRGVE
ncbi:MAG: phosphatidylinositol-specific phospholipase C [Pseudonocardiaceae bacterium]